MDAESETLIAHSLRADGFDASEDGTGRGTPIVPCIAQTVTADMYRSGGAVSGNNDQGVRNCFVVPAVAFNLRGHEGGAMPETTEVASLRSASGGSSRSYVAQMAVRRLTPTECARLQGFQDDHCRVKYRGKEAADGPMYKAYGNSMAIPVIAWIGKRIVEVDAKVRFQV